MGNKEKNNLSEHSTSKLLRLAKSKMRRSDFTEARELYQFILNKFPNNAEAKKNLKSIEKNLDTKKNHTSDNNNLRKILTLRNSGHVNQALELALNLENSESQSSDLLNLIGVLYFETGQVNDSIKYYKHALKINALRADIYNNLANAYIKLRRVEEAVELYERAIEISPDYSDAYFNFANLRKNQGELRAALGLYNSAIRSDPNNTSALFNRANILKDMGRIDSALGSYLLALEKKPDYYDCLQNFGNLVTQVSSLNEDNNFSEQLLRFLKYSETYCNVTHISVLQALIYFLVGDYQRTSEIISLQTRTSVTATETQTKFVIAYYTFLKKLVTYKSSSAGLNGSENIYHLGESHCLSYAHQTISWNFTSYKIKPKITFGAKAYHFAMSGNNQYKAITRKHFSSIPKNSKVFISFGEIDCRADEGILRAVAKLKTTRQLVITNTVEGYVNWMHEQSIKFSLQLYFMSVPAPVYNTILSENKNEEIAAVIYEFNDQLNTLASAKGHKIMDCHSLTKNLAGFSNNNYHIDNVHLSPVALQDMITRLS